ncbi:protein of unknown function DUF4246 [Aspergillus terreus]|uniref:Uncharacterized protein n=1 Tax=Aspergillus terreus TaxID=33178 RepID=A0A5M3YML7_ASPTE|nr:hypothetical protein ATETN484_0001011100 [Aspergillus terreus]GFF11892.1 protein of unknown function DUF4246 [Aspergillus terreus]
MKRLSFLLLCMLVQLLVGTVEALNAAAGAETTYFYQAFLLEREHVTDAKRHLIAPGWCPKPKDNAKCSFAEFVKDISTRRANEANEENWPRFKEIFDNAESGNTPLVETSKNLREAGFKVDYDQNRLYPKEVKSPSVSNTIRGMRGIATATKTNKYPDQKRKMIEALELKREVRRADNMKWFIPKLEEATGVKLATNPATTPDGLPYTTYDVDATAKENEGIKDLAQKITTAAETLRNAKKTVDNLDFAIHQGVIREADLSLSELRKKCP